MFNSFKDYTKYILLIILLIIFIVTYLQSQKINELKRINNELKYKKDDAFMYIFSTSRKSIEFAESLENLSYIEADAHYNEYKDLFKKADKDLKEWKSEINQLISLGVDNGISNNTPKYYSSAIDNVVMMYRFNNISPADFSEEWKLALQNTAELLISLNEEMNSIKRSNLFYMENKDVIKRMVIEVLEQYFDQISKINNDEVERLRNQIEELIEKNWKTS